MLIKHSYHLIPKGKGLQFRVKETPKEVLCIY